MSVAENPPAAAPGETMRALLVKAGGPLGEARLGQVPVPAAGRGEVRIAMRATALNAVDVKQGSGAMAPFNDPPVVGFDIAGTVVEVGSGEARLAVGDEVIASTLAGGSIAEYALAREDARIARRPPDLDVAHGAALPSAAFTAAEMVASAELGSSERVLVLGASGGVGTFLVQMVAQAGARAIATGLPADADLLRRLGAETVIDYRSDDVLKATLELTSWHGVDAILDVVSVGEQIARVARVLRPGGRLVSALSGPARVEPDLIVFYPTIAPTQGVLDGLIEQVRDGRLEVVVGEVWDFDRATDALQQFDLGHTVGKVVIAGPVRATPRGSTLEARF